MSSLSTRSGAGAPTAAAPHARDNYSFKKTDLLEIGRGNSALLNRLAAVATRRPELAAPTTARVVAESSAQRNRRKAAAEIEKANLRLLSKLQSTKSTVSAIQGKAAGPPRRLLGGGGSSAMRGAGAGAGESLALRPQWCDPLSNARPGDTDAWRKDATTTTKASVATKAPRDLRDIAMFASTDRHTL